MSDTYEVALFKEPPTDPVYADMFPVFRVAPDAAAIIANLTQERDEALDGYSIRDDEVTGLLAETKDLRAQLAAMTKERNDWKGTAEALNADLLTTQSRIAELEAALMKIADRCPTDSANYSSASVGDVARHALQSTSTSDPRDARIKELEAALADRQAKIDGLMLEYCPSEMTPEQLAEWGRSQQAISQEAQTAIDAALKGAPATSPWQPIETAPKDVTRITLCYEGGPVWCDCAWEKLKFLPDCWRSFIGVVPFNPTLWMPQPSAPSVPAEKGGE